MPTPDKAGGIRDRPGKCCRVCFLIEKAGERRTFLKKEKKISNLLLHFFRRVL